MSRFSLVAVGCAVVLVGVAAASVPAARVGSRSGTACVPRWGVIARSARVPDLTDVSALSPSDVWAVGTVGKYPRQTPVATHWDGRRLHVMAPFKSSPGDDLQAVVAIAKDDVWAAGSRGAGRLSRPLVVHWDGRRWSVVATPREPVAGGLYDIAAFGPNDVWAVGFGGGHPLVMRWNGQRWRVIEMRKYVPELYSSPRGSHLSAIDGTSSRDVWAVGVTGEGGELYGYGELIVHWDGHAWKRVSSSLADDNQSPLAIDVVSPREMWTLHLYWEGDEQVVHWKDGVSKVAHAYDANEFGLNDVEAVSQTDAWIAATYYPDPSGSGPSFPRLMHWGGRSWHIEHTALDRLPDTSRTSPNGSLNSLSALSATDIWAAGTNLLARYAC